MKCEDYECNVIVKVSEVRKWGAYSLCEICYDKATRRESNNYA